MNPPKYKIDDQVVHPYGNSSRIAKITWGVWDSDKKQWNYKAESDGNTAHFSEADVQYVFNEGSWHTENIPQVVRIGHAKSLSARGA